MHTLLKYSTLFIWSSIKYLTAPAYGMIVLGYGFTENLIVNFIGGCTGIAVFYYLSNYFTHRSKRKLERKKQEALEKGVVLKPKKKFTRFNKLVIKVKMRLGFWGVVLLTPCILSIPIGCVITAKFYGDRKNTFTALILSMLVSSIGLTLLMYWLDSLFGSAFTNLIKNVIPSS
jgi:hypothetical protein